MLGTPKSEALREILGAHFGSQRATLWAAWRRHALEAPDGTKKNECGAARTPTHTARKTLSAGPFSMESALDAAVGHRAGGRIAGR